MLDLLWGVIAFSLMVAAIYKWHTHHVAPQTASRLTVMCAVGSTAVAFAMQMPLVQDLVDGLTGRTATGQHIGHLAIVSACCAAQVFVVQVTREPAAAARLTRWLLVFLVIVEAALVALFVTGAHRALAHDPTVSRYGVAYAAVYTMYALATGFMVMRLSWRSARWTDHDYVRCNLRMLSATYLAVIWYAGVELGFAVARAAGYPTSQATELGAIAPFMAAGGMCGALGGTFASWGPRVPALQAPVRWLGRRRSLRVLRPLWSDLYEAMPDLALEQPRSRWSDLLAVTGLDRRLHRRVIEIEDGLLRLRSHRNPVVEELAAAAVGPELDEQSRRAVIEATAVAAARSARAHGRTFPVVAAPSASGLVNPEPDAEMAWLRLVALAYRHSPVVSAVRAQLDAADDTRGRGGVASPAVAPTETRAVTASPWSAK